MISLIKKITNLKLSFQKQGLQCQKREEWIWQGNVLYSYVIKA